VIRSQTYKRELSKYAKAFKKHKDDLRTLLTEYTSIKVTQMNQSLNSMNSKFDTILNFIQQQTPLEARVVDKIEQFGGEEKAIKVHVICLTLGVQF
jgi:hypothetical protein